MVHLGSQGGEAWQAASLVHLWPQRMGKEKQASESAYSEIQDLVPRLVLSSSIT